MKLQNRITGLMQKLEAEGKLTILSDDVVQEIQDEINAEMEAFRIESRRKQAQSAADTEKVIVSQQAEIVRLQVAGVDAAMSEMLLAEELG